MTFRPRNTYYLRISSITILPLYLYLDDQHLDWMSDRVLQHVLADLRPLIVPKLQAEKDTYFGPGAAFGKKGTVEVHRGDFYQFAYFFRKIEPHSIVTKTRHFVAAPLPQVPPTRSVASVRSRSDKKRRDDEPTVGGRVSYKRRKTRNESEELTSSVEDSEGDVMQAHHRGDTAEPRRSQRLNRVTANRYHESEDEAFDTSDDVDMHGPSGSAKVAERASSSDCDVGTPPTENDTQDQELGPLEIDLTTEMEEEKPKPSLRLKYQALSVSGHCLCVVVEPWQHPIARLRSVSPLSVKPSNVGSSRDEILAQRGQTPLFFPEFDETLDQGHGISTSAKTYPPVPLFDEADESFNGGTLMNFSQALNTAGHTATISFDDDDEIDGAVLFGDADEIREFS
ncbi:hypothetical protein J3A83DRAFT_4489346 [Scleroderma citrinum]